MLQKFKRLYHKSPMFLKRIIVNIEGIRRNVYRRGGSYKYFYKSLNVEKILNRNDQKKQIEEFDALLKFVTRNVPFYRNNNSIPDKINKIYDIDKLPVTDKNSLSNNIHEFFPDKGSSKLWKSRSSGSTGTPKTFFRDKKSMSLEYAMYDKLYDYIAQTNNSTKARISGVDIIEADKTNPPYWCFIDVFNQLQLSSMHITSETFFDYIGAMKKYNVDIGTGYSSSWLDLANHILRNSYNGIKLKGIITDSEGLTNNEKEKIERAFNCKVYQTYGLGEVGMVGLQCNQGHYHVFSNRIYFEILNENGEKVETGNEGELVVTDLTSYRLPYIRYRTGDNAIAGSGLCECGMGSPYIKQLIGRIDDYIITPDGRKISRLGSIIKPAKGVLKSQLIQWNHNFVEIKVVPDHNFDPLTMESVLKKAEFYFGTMKITWTVVDKLEKTNSGKTKFVIRKL